MNNDVRFYFSPDYNLSYEYKQNARNSMFAEHSHKTYEIYYLISGKRNFFIKNQRFIINEGTLIFIAPDIMHKTLNLTENTYGSLVINFSPSVLPPHILKNSNLKNLLEKDFFIIETEGSVRDFLNLCVFRFSEAIKEKNCGYELKLFGIFFEILSLIECSSESRNGSETGVYPSNSQIMVNGIIEYITEHFKEDITLEKISDTFFISPYYLCRIFKKHTGSSLHDYITTVRVNEAKNILNNNNDIKISALYKKCGFKSQTTFIRAFKAKLGITPLQYRKKT